MNAVGRTGHAMREITEDEAVLLRKMYQGPRFGGSHLLEANLLHGIPRDRVDRLRQALRPLKREGIVQAKATAHDPAVSIPAWLVRDVRSELRKHYPDLMGPENMYGPYWRALTAPLSFSSILHGAHPRRGARARGGAAWRR